MQRKLDELWLDVLESRIDHKIVVYLMKDHEEYQKIRNRQNALTKKYPSLISFLDGNESITLSAEEHNAVKEYLRNRDEIAGMEKEYSYYYGQAGLISYGMMLKNLYQMIEEGMDETDEREI